MLLVEDDRPTALAYEALLNIGRPDIAVETVWSAEAALVRLTQSDYDVIVSDFKLPGLDGLCLLVASYCLHSHIPFVLVSAYGDRALEESAARLGAYAVLHKPTDPEAFLDVVSRALTRGREVIDHRLGIDGPANTSLQSRGRWLGADAESTRRQ
jgi:DNA-binding NtrC family response regulator